MTASRRPTVAISNRMFTRTRDLLDYVRRTDCRAVEYSFPKDVRSTADIDGDAVNVGPLVEAGLTIRYHCPFFEVELARADRQAARADLEIFKRCADVAADHGGQWLNVHVGLTRLPLDVLDYDTALRHMAELVEYGKAKGVNVGLENLTRPWNNDPAVFLEMLEKTRAPAIFDLGHANACPWVEQGRGTSLDFLGMVEHLVRGAHVYEIEKIDPDTGMAYHVYPRDLHMIEGMLERLLDTACDWWLVELNKPDEVDHTRSLLKAFLDKRFPSA